jgi:hypothetical protein
MGMVIEVAKRKRKGQDGGNPKKTYSATRSEPLIFSEGAVLFSASAPKLSGVAILNKSKALEILSSLLAENDLMSLKSRVADLKRIVSLSHRDEIGLLNIESNGDTLRFRRDVLLSELEQILESRTVERARYYLRRLEKSIRQVQTNRINDINFLRWKEYNEILTESLWILGKRDTSGVHMAWYWGNFVPQIPRQLMLRFTKKGDWVIDPFVGSGTTLIECRRLQRNGLGVEINPAVAERARELVAKEENPGAVVSDIVVGDSTTTDFQGLLRPYGRTTAQLVILHPPYHDIIKFSEDPRDLSNTGSISLFLERFSAVVDAVGPALETGRYLALVMGDKYSKGEWIPLGFYCMNEVLKRGDYLLKGIIVKNFEDTRAKRNQKELWRYRALVGGFYIFKHEYIFLFRKVK